MSIISLLSWLSWTTYVSQHYAPKCQGHWSIHTHLSVTQGLQYGKWRRYREVLIPWVSRGLRCSARIPKAQDVDSSRWKLEHIKSVRSKIYGCRGRSWQYLFRHELCYSFFYFPLTCPPVPGTYMWSVSGFWIPSRWDQAQLRGPCVPGAEIPGRLEKMDVLWLRSSLVSGRENEEGWARLDSVLKD